MQTKGGTGLDIGNAVAHHPRFRKVGIALPGQRLPKHPRLRLAAVALVLRPVEANMRAEDSASRRGRGRQHRRMGRLQVLPRGLTLRPGRLIGDDRDPISGLRQPGQRIGNKGQDLYLIGMQGTVHRALFRIDHEAVQDAVAVEQDHWSTHDFAGCSPSQVSKSRSPAGEPTS